MSQITNFNSSQPLESLGLSYIDILPLDLKNSIQLISDQIKDIRASKKIFYYFYFLFFLSLSSLSLSLIRSHILFF